MRDGRWLTNERKEGWEDDGEEWECEWDAVRGVMEEATKAERPGSLPGGALEGLPTGSRGSPSVLQTV